MEQALEELRGRLKKRELLALLPVLFAERQRGNTLAWGATIMNVTILACPAVLLCSLLVAGGVVWRASSRPRPEGATVPVALAGKGDSAGTVDRRAPSVDPDVPGIFGTVIDRDREAPLAGALISAYDS